MVLVFADKGHVVGFLVQPFPIEEIVGVKGVVCIVLGPVWSGGLTIKAESLTLAHGINELLADVLSDVCVRLTTQSNFDNLGPERCKLRLVLHEGADAALLVPDEQVLLRFFGLADWRLKFLESERGPGC